MQIEPRRAVIGLLIAGAAGAFLFLPAITFVGTTFVPVPTPATTHIAPLLGDAIWARALGGRATELQPVNPFTIARMASCHLMAEQAADQSERQREHDECMKLIPAVQAVGYLANVNMRSHGVWQDPRVPFAAVATVNQVTNTWTRAQLLDTLAEQGEYGRDFKGAEQASQGLFGRATAALTLPQAALLAAMLGEKRVDPWCAPEQAALLRRQVLERMRENLAIDDDAFEQADRTDVAVADVPGQHPPCKG